MSDLQSVGSNPYINYYELTSVDVEDANSMAKPKVDFSKSSSASAWSYLEGLAIQVKSQPNSTSPGLLNCGFGWVAGFDNPRKGDGGVAPDAGDGGVVCQNFPSSADLISPGSSVGVGNVSLRPTFSWDPAVDPDAGDSVAYTLVLANNENFDAALEIGGLTNTEYTLGIDEALELATDYYWKIIATDTCDQSIESGVYIFRTNESCDNNTEPSDFSLVSPSHDTSGNNRVSLTPFFDWSDALNLDPGEMLSYRLVIDTVQTLDNNPIIIDGIPNSEYQLQQTLEYGQQYYWRAFAIDDCHEKGSTEIFGFNTELECIPQTIVETDFVTGDASNVKNDIIPGSLMLGRNWSYEWTAFSGLLPTQTNPAFVLNNPASATTQFAVDPITGKNALYINTIGFDDSLSYEMSPGFINSTGWSVQMQVRTVNTEGTTGSECSVDITDGSKQSRMGLSSTGLLEPFSSSSHALNTTDGIHTYRIQAIGSSFEIFVDNTSVITGSMGDSSNSYLNFGDNFGLDDSESYWYSVKFYDLGNVAPYLNPGTYVSQVYDASGQNDLGNGATITFNGTTSPTTFITIETRTGNTAIPDGSWSSWSLLSGNQISSPSNRYFQVRAELDTSNASVTPVLDDYQIDYCSY
jgi:hypothetical protein